MSAPVTLSSLQLVAEPRWRFKLVGRAAMSSEEVLLILEMGLSGWLVALEWRKLFQSTANSLREIFLRTIPGRSKVSLVEIIVE